MALLRSRIVFWVWVLLAAVCGGMIDHTFVTTAAAGTIVLPSASHSTSGRHRNHRLPQRATPQPGPLRAQSVILDIGPDPSLAERAILDGFMQAYCHPDRTNIQKAAVEAAVFSRLTISVGLGERALAEYNVSRAQGACT